MSCIDPSVRIVTKSPKVGLLLPSPLPSASFLSFSVFLCVTQRDGEYEKERKLADGRGEGGSEGGAKSYDREKALVLYKSINTIL